VIDNRRNLEDLGCKFTCTSNRTEGEEKRKKAEKGKERREFVENIEEMEEDMECGGEK
jgi:hypothetical protein